jgi:hypothetical protein
MEAPAFNEEQPMPQARAKDLHTLITSEPQDPSAILAAIVSLRESLIAAWQERSVTFTREERIQLKEEIETTASLLNDLILID